MSEVKFVNAIVSVFLPDLNDQWLSEQELLIYFLSLSN